MSIFNHGNTVWRLGNGSTGASGAVVPDLELTVASDEEFIAFDPARAIAGFSLPVVAGETYELQLHGTLRNDGAGLASGFELTLTETASASSIISAHAMQEFVKKGASSPLVFPADNANSNGKLTTSNMDSLQTATTAQLDIIAIVRVYTTGTMVLRGVCSDYNVKLKAGTTITMTKIN